MPAVTVPKGALSFGAGYLYVADAGVAAPTNTVAGSVFTDTWPVGWNLWGVTREGHTLNIEIDSEPVEAAEYIDPLLNVTTGRTITAEFEIMQIHLTNFRRAFNGGTKTPTGSGATLLTTYTLPAIGAEGRPPNGGGAVGKHRALGGDAGLPDRLGRHPAAEGRRQRQPPADVHARAGRVQPAGVLRRG